MAININEVLPLLDAISTQQRDISARLSKLITIFRREPEPVEPVLRSMLKPLREGMDEMRETLQAPTPRD
ncbi:hypothetical protein H3H39_09250 [Duganella sp. LX47W]|uniref:Uncharacterized protein n=1 Tax=Rugamonas apoptosis TaxID=2758570 RepID=A0A7W2IKB4_9BURK|nr:hypothetical protein [Rugamonas apoptosis]